MAKEPQTPKDLVQQVLEETANDRRAAHADFNKATRDLQARIDQINEDTAHLGRALANARADVAAHARFEKRMKRQDWDTKKRLLDAALADAQAEFRAAQRKGQEAVAPLQERQNAAAAKCKALADEWQAHQRIAKATGVDATAYWTPENPTAGQAEEDDSEMPAVVM